MTRLKRRCLAHPDMAYHDMAHHDIAHQTGTAAVGPGRIARLEHSWCLSGTPGQHYIPQQFSRASSSPFSSAALMFTINTEMCVIIRQLRNVATDWYGPFIFRSPHAEPQSWKTKIGGKISARTFEEAMAKEEWIFSTLFNFSGKRKRNVLRYFLSSESWMRKQEPSELTCLLKKKPIH